jgi:hypothetical protein
MGGGGRSEWSEPQETREKLLMSAVVQAPVELMEAVAALRLPPKADKHLQELMDRNNNGSLRQDEKQELEALVELSETLSLVRAQALHLLGRTPV